MEGEKRLLFPREELRHTTGTGTAPVPLFNALLLHLVDLTAKCSNRFPFGFQVVCNVICALVSQAEIAFWDQEEVEKSPEWSFQTRQFSFLMPYYVATVVMLNVNAFFLYP